MIKKERLIKIIEIAIIPCTIVFLSMWMDNHISERQDALATKLTETQIKIQKELAKRQESIVLTQTIDSYFEGVGDLLKDSSNKNWDIIVARTTLLLHRLKNQPKELASIVKFVSITKPELLKLSETKNYINLSGLNFGNSDLSGVNLKYANLVGCVFDGANLYNTDLQFADLTKSKFYSTYLTEANFSHANLKDVFLYRPILEAGYFVETESSPDWIKAGQSIDRPGYYKKNHLVKSIKGNSFRTKNLEGADLSNTDLSSVDLSGSNLIRANLFSANLTGSDLSGAKLRSAFFRDAKMENTKLNGADLDNTTWIKGEICSSGSKGECK